LERVLDPSWLDEVFEEYRGRQYERELLFSTVVDSSEDPAMEDPEREPSQGSPFKVFAVTWIRASPRRGEAADVCVGE
jgi:hypothetical protein